MPEEKGSLNVRRMVGAILLAVIAISMFAENESVSGAAMFGAVRYYQEFLYFYIAWAVGIAIWYFVTLKKPTNKKAELIVKIIFYIVIAMNAIVAFSTDVFNAGVFGIGLMIFYSIGCPWGKQGYKKHPYPTTEK